MCGEVGHFYVNNYTKVYRWLSNYLVYLRKISVMKLIRSISTTLLLLIFTVTPLSAKKKTDYPRAEIKVEYDYHSKFMRGDEEVIEKNIPFILLANSTQSKF